MRCGTYAGYQRHKADRTATCGPCREANNRYYKRRGWDLSNGRPRVVPSVGTRRRLRALAAIGWPWMELGRRLGIGSNAWRLGRDGVPVLARTAEAVTALYEELCMTPGPSARARSAAAQHGWPPPLAWDNPDDPDEQPRGLPQSSGMRVAGVAAVWDDLRWEDVDRLRSYGVPDEQIAGRFGVTAGAMVRAEHRCRRTAGTPAA